MQSSTLPTRSYLDVFLTKYEYREVVQLPGFSRS